MALETQPLYGPVQNLTWLVGIIAGLIILYVFFKMFHSMKK
jgi:hypothetical protein